MQIDPPLILSKSLEGSCCKLKLQHLYFLAGGTATTFFYI